MQALILAAGMGKRLGDLTSDRTKCMVEMGGKTLLVRLLEQLQKRGIPRVTIVIGFCGDALRNAIGGSFGTMQISYIANPIYDTTNNIYSLYLARHVLLEDDTLLFEADLVLEDSIIERMVSDPRPNLAVVAPYQSWMDGTVLTLDGDDSITGFVSKRQFDFNKVADYHKTVNIYRFSKEFAKSHCVPFLEAYCQAMGHNEYYEQVFSILTFIDRASHGTPSLFALRLTDEKWYEIDDAQDLANAETLFANEEHELESYMSRYGGYWRFPFLKDFCYLVNPFFPPARLIEEMKGNFGTLLTQYPSGQRVNRLLAAKMFGVKPDQIVVGNGAAELIKSLQRNFSGITGIVRPAFEEYPNRTPPEHLRTFSALPPHFRYSVDQLLAFCETESVNRLVLINPDNPTGHFISFENVCRLAAELKSRNIELLLDESFVDFADAPQSFLNAKILDEFPNLIVVKSISKSYGVPGIRLGVAASSQRELIHSVARDIAIWNINSYAEFFMQIIGKYEQEYRSGCALLAQERKRFTQRLAATEQLRILPSQANYVFCEVLLPETPDNLTRKLLRHYGILIRDCSNKSGVDGTFVRIAIKSPAENDSFIRALHELHLK